MFSYTWSRLGHVSQEVSGLFGKSALTCLSLVTGRVLHRGAVRTARRLPAIAAIIAHCARDPDSRTKVTGSGQAPPLFKW